VVVESDRSAIIIIRVWFDAGQFRAKVIAVPDASAPFEAVSYGESPDVVAGRVFAHLQSFADPGGGDANATLP
jgi:hypothetical protein